MDAYKSAEGKKLLIQAVQESYKDCPVDTESQLLETEGFGKTHILISGPAGAAPLILLHGTSGNSTAWFGMLPRLSETFRVYAIDIPGQPGLSDSERPGLNNGDLRKWLVSVLDILNLDKPGIAGLSLGAWLALSLAINEPQRISGLVMLSPSGICSPKIGFYLRVIPLAFMGSPGHKRIFKLIHGPVPVHPGMAEFAKLVSRNFNTLRELPEIIPDEELKALRIPVLLIGGEQDVMLNMPGSTMRLRKNLPEAVAILRPGMSHVLPDEGKAIVEFLHSST